MSKELTSFGLDPSKLIRLLDVCADKGAMRADMALDEQKAELLQDRLSETLLSGSLKSSPLRKELTHFCRMSGLLAGETVRNLLNDPGTDIELIRKVKEHGKRLSQAASGDLEHDTANVIYFAAIAHALVFHNAKITKFSYEDLGQSFSVFGKMKWVSSDLVDLFLKAGNYCEVKVKEEK